MHNRKIRDMIQVLGIPYDSNSSFLKGPSLAPARIRLMDVEGSANAYAENGLEIVEGRNYSDQGDIHFPTTDSKKAFAIIKENIRERLQASDKVLSIGGDHSVSWPILDAYTDKYPGLHVLHLDAHTDLYESFDDNPLSHASPFARLAEKGKTASITQVGIRTLTTHHREQAKKFNVSIVEMKDFSFDFIKDLKGPLYISLDIDVLDPAFAPGISHHEPGGLSTRQLLQIIQSINVEVVGADIVEYNPTRDINNMTAMVAYKMMKELIAKMV
jgi:arginase